MERLLFALTFVSALGAALIAGVFFAFSAFVMRALGRLPQANGISAMQAINIAVLNPVFFAAFFGTGATCLLLAAAAMIRWPDPAAAALLSGSLLYLIGCLAVTLVFNVPLNNRLATVGNESGAAEGVWGHYLSSWTAWNHVRTVSSFAAAAAFIIALS